LSRDYTVQGYDIVDTTSWSAQLFQVGAGGLTLTSATLSIAGYDPILSTPGVPPANTPKLTIREHVYYYNGGNDYWIPGNVVATLTGPVDIEAADWEFTHTGYALSANTKYWAVLEDNGLWNYYLISDCGPSPGYACCGLAFTLASNAGANWEPAYDEYGEGPYLLLINGQDLS